MFDIRYSPALRAPHAIETMPFICRGETCFAPTKPCPTGIPADIAANERIGAQGGGKKGPCQLQNKKITPPDLPLKRGGVSGLQRGRQHPLDGNGRGTACRAPTKPYLSGIPLRNHAPHIFTYTQKKRPRPPGGRRGRSAHSTKAPRSPYRFITFTISLPEAVITRTV